MDYSLYGSFVLLCNFTGETINLLKKSKFEKPLFLKAFIQFHLNAFK